MKKILAATLAFSLLGATAASAAPYGHYGRGDNGGAAIAAGIGILALGAILASQHHDYDRDYRYRGYDQQRWDRNDYRAYDSYGRGYGR